VKIRNKSTYAYKKPYALMPEGVKRPMGSPETLHRMQWFICLLSDRDECFLSIIRRLEGG